MKDKPQLCGQGGRATKREESNLVENTLERLGYDEWFKASGKDYLRDGLTPARIVEVNKNNFKVNDGQHEMLAELTGKFLFGAHSNADFPTTGDWVVIQAYDNHTSAVIHNILSRKSLLKRKEPGKVIDFQLIAANIDYGLIVQSADANINLNRLERYLVMVNESRIKPIIVVSKIDLMSVPELTSLDEQVRKLNSSYLLISNISDQGILNLENALEAGKTYCLLGPSGVGKTTLLNRLVGQEIFRVNEVREKDGKGRHTTVRRQLVCLESGSIFIDTPGMKELGNFSINDGMEETFDDILPYCARCRFNDCTHTHEEGCAVIEAVDQGNLDSERYMNFLKIKKESAYYEMSYLEKRRKDKAFGKMVKNYKKLKRKTD